MAASGVWRALKRRTYELLDPVPGGALLDVGCGTGDDVRALAEMVGPAGCVVGVDRSAAMLEEARRRAEASRLPVVFQRADARSLCFRAGSFDGCRAERVLQHLDDPERAVHEMVRVARPGGRVVVVEPDYGTLAIAGADPALTRRILDHRRAHFRTGRIGGQLPAIFKALGLRGIAVSLTTLASADAPAGPWHDGPGRYAAGACEAGVVSADEAAAWLGQLRAAAAEGRFRHALVVVTASGRKP